MIGLHEAMSRFEQGPGSTFETYAARRIEGAMLDMLRADDHLSRQTRSQLREARAAVQRLEHSLGRAPRAKEVANELHWSLEKFHSCMAEAGAGGMRTGDADLEHQEDPSHGDDSFEDRVDTGEHADPERALRQRQRHAVLNSAFDALEEAERFVMESIYDRDLAPRDIGQALGVSEARISQIRAEIVAKLRRRLRDV